MIFDYNIIPFVSVGPFVFREKILRYIQQYAYTKLERKNKNELECYLFEGTDGDFEVACDENDCIAVVTCRDKCIYAGFDLILLDIDTFLKQNQILQVECKIEEIDMNDNKSLTIYYIEKIGLQLWVNDKCEIEIVDIFEG